MIDKTTHGVKITNAMTGNISLSADTRMLLPSHTTDNRAENRTPDNPKTIKPIARDHAVALAEKHPLISVFDVVMGLRKSDHYHPSIAHGLTDHIDLHKLPQEELIKLFEKIIFLENHNYIKYLVGNPSLNKIPENDLNLLAERFILQKSSLSMPQELLKNIDLRKLNSFINEEIFAKAAGDASLKNSLETNQRKMNYTLLNNGSVIEAS